MQKGQFLKPDWPGDERVQHGIVLTQIGKDHEDGMLIKTVCSHKKGQFHGLHYSETWVQEPAPPKKRKNMIDKEYWFVLCQWYVGHVSGKYFKSKEAALHNYAKMIKQKPMAVTVALVESVDMNDT